MMARIDAVRDVLNMAESSLRELSAEAAKSGNYDEVVQIAELAKQLHSAASRLTNSVRDTSPANRPLPTEPSNGTNNTFATSTSGSQVRNALARVPKGQRRASRKNGYPKFLRRGNDLVKIGWSKGTSKEYQHKAPRSVIHAVAQSLVEKAPNGEILSTDQFLPNEQPESGEEIPAYQAYVCLAWLRNTGIVEQAGRQGYSLSDAASVVKRIDEEWSRLPPK